MIDIFYLIAQVSIVIFVVWLIDRILLAIFGPRWRMPREYEEEREKRQFPTFGS